MRRQVAAVVRAAFAAAVAAEDLPAGLRVGWRVGPPERPQYGDLACDAAIDVARQIGRRVDVVAATLLRYLVDPGGWFLSVEAGGPGFLNFRIGRPLLWKVLADVGTALDPEGAAPGSPGRRTVETVGDAHPAQRWRMDTVAGALAALQEVSPTEPGSAPPVQRVGPVDARAGLSPARGRRFMSVGPVRVFRRGVRVDVLEAERPDGPRAAAALRFALLRAPTGDLVDLDLDIVAAESFENPAFAVEFARQRIGRLLEVVDGRTAPAVDLARLGEREAALAWQVVSWPDVRQEVRETLALERIPRFASALAAAFHGYYNRAPVMTNDPALDRARMALVRTAGRVLDQALGIVGIDGGAG